MSGKKSTAPSRKPLDRPCSLCNKSAPEVRFYTRSTGYRLSACVGCSSKSKKRWEDANQEHRQQWWKSYYAENKGKRCEKDRQRYWADPEKYKAKSRAYYSLFPARKLEARKRWIHSHPEKYVQYNNARRALVEGNGGAFTSVEWFNLKVAYANSCAFCGEVADLTVDHIVPISRGGRNDISNIQPLCRPCNSKKGNRLLGTNA